MKTLLIKKLIVALAATVLCVTLLHAQIPEKLTNLPYFKQRALMFESLGKSHSYGKMNKMRCSPNAPCLTAQTTLGGTGDDFAYTIIPTRDGGFAIVGGTNSGDGDFKVPASNGSDAYLAKYNKYRQLEWTKTLGGTGEDNFTAVAQTLDGGYIAVGQSESTDGDIKENHGGFDVLVVKFSASGKVEWQKSFGGSGDEFGEGVVQTFYGGYAIVAFTSSNDGNVSGNHTTDGDFDGWFIQIGAKGNLLFQHCYGGSDFDGFFSMVSSNNGSFILEGASGSNDGDVSGNHGNGDAWVVKVNAFGKILWQKCVGGSGSEGDGNNDIATTADGNIIIDGGSNSTDGDINAQNDTSVSFVAKLNSSTGNIIWSKSYAEPSLRNGGEIFATSDGGAVECSQVAPGFDVTTYDVLISKFDRNGNQEWYKRLGGSDYDGAVTGYELANHDLNIVCLTISTDGDVKNNHGGVDEWIIKLGRCENYIADDATSPDDVTASTKNNSTTLSAYPNPVSNSASISFDLSQTQKVSVTIYDMNGRLIKTLVDAQMEVGNHQLTWNAKSENVIAGTYLLKMQAGDKIETKKISVVR